MTHLLQRPAIRSLFEQEHVDRGKHPFPNSRSIQITSLKQRVVLHRRMDRSVGAMLPDEHLRRAVDVQVGYHFPYPSELPQCAA
jgi:hypothetical protein